jgi:flagellar biosynthetic protein FliR
MLVIPLHPLLIFLIVLARVGGLVSFAPFWSHNAAPARVRAILALMLALVITPIVQARLPTPPTDLIPFFVLLFGEVVIGIALGFAGRIVLSALDMAAHVVGFQMGFSLAGTIDPATHAQTAAFGTIAQMLGLLMLMTTNAHHWMLAAMVRSLLVVPVGSATVSQGLIDLFIRLSADAIAVGVALAAPMIILLITVEFALAIAGRAAPQLQIMILGFPIKIAVGLWLLGSTLYFMPGAVHTLLGSMKSAMTRTLSLM